MGTRNGEVTARGAARAHRRRLAVVGFVGRSGAGKTTLLERLLPVLAARGLAVGAVKHASHGFVADRAGSDSHRLYESGAAAVALISRHQLATFVRSGAPDPDPRLEVALRTLPRGLDVVLVEGFSWEPIPRVVLVRGSEPPLPQHLAGGEVLRVVRTPVPRPGQKPEFPRDLIDLLAGEIAHRGAAIPFATDGGGRRPQRRRSSHDDGGAGHARAPDELLARGPLAVAPLPVEEEA